MVVVAFSCNRIDSNTQVAQNQYEYPVLKNKEFNNVLELIITSADTLRQISMKEIVINTMGTTDLNDIESIALYYTGKKDGRINDARVLVSETNKISSTVKLKCNFRLDSPKNFFWVSYRLKDNAGLTNRFGGYCEKINTSDGEASVSMWENPIYLRSGVALRKHGDDSVHTYRIPGLATTNSGTLLAVYDVRRSSSRDLQGDIDIGISRSTDGGNSWEPMTIALDMGEWGDLPQKFNGVSDASLLVDRNTGDIYVAGLWMYGVINEQGKWIENLTEESDEWNHQWRNRGSQPGFDVKETSQFMIARSRDDGKTWEKAVNLTRMCKKSEWWLWAPAPGNGICMDDGTLVFPTQGRDKDGLPFSNITWSKDGGITWETSKPAFHNTTESAVVQLDDGSVMLNMRYNPNRNNNGDDNGRVIAVTNDMGNTWSEHPTSRNALIESTCMASLYKHEYSEDGVKRSVLLFSNPNTKEGRHHMTIKVSFDNGLTWPEENWLLLDEGSGNGYSCITGIDEDNIGILYEGSQSNLVFQKIPLNELINPPF